MSARAKSPPGKGKGKAEATPEELAAAEAARLTGALAAAEAAKATEASDRNYAQLERVRHSLNSSARPLRASAACRVPRPAWLLCSRLGGSALRRPAGVSLTVRVAPRRPPAARRTRCLSSGR